MVQYLSCIEGRGIQHVRVGLRVFWGQAVEEHEPLTVNGRSRTVGLERFFKTETFALGNPTSTLLIAHVQPKTEAGKFEAVGPPTRQPRLDDGGSVWALHALAKKFVEGAVHVQFIFAQFPKGSQRHASPFCFLTEHITTVEAGPPEASYQSVDQRTGAAARMARDGHLDHAYNTHS